MFIEDWNALTLVNNHSKCKKTCLSVHNKPVKAVLDTFGSHFTPSYSSET